MYKWLRSGIAAVLLLMWIAPASVSAYSYGDANTEDVAETYKLIEAAVGGASADWQTAAEAHKVRRSEIASHFGEAVAVTLDRNIEAQDGKLLIANYKAVLVMNLERRFTYAIQGVEDYAATKLLLAKAKATFDTLAPFTPAATVTAVNEAFDEALAALGNPGLFGVGKKPVQPEVFKEKVGFIHTTMKPLFVYTAYVPPQEPAGPEPSASPTPKPTPKPSPQATPAPSASTGAAAAAASAEPTAASSAAPQATAEAVSEPEPTESPAATPAAPEASPEPSADDPEPSAEPEPSVEPSATALPAELAQADTAEHAPMERTDKTNTMVTVLVIAGVAVVGGGAVWLIRKKGWL